MEERNDLFENEEVNQNLQQNSIGNEPDNTETEVSNDTQNALRGTHTFVIDAYVDFRLRDPQAVVTVKIGQ